MQKASDMKVSNHTASIYYSSEKQNKIGPLPSGPNDPNLQQ